MKKTLLLLLCIPLCMALKAQEKDYDTVAIMILDRMSNIIGDLSSCNFTVNTVADYVVNNKAISNFTNSEVYMVGPDKMMVNSNGTKGHRGFYYDDSLLTYYSFDENNYATIPAPGSIMEAIDSVHNAYGLDFPAADFFYPTFTDDFLSYVDVVDYMGIEYIDGKPCFHIYGTGKEADIQLWISNDAFMLPCRFVIHYKTSHDLQRYQAGFSDWHLNPELPGSMFSFLPPPGANELYLMPENSND